MQVAEVQWLSSQLGSYLPRRKITAICPDFIHVSQVYAICPDFIHVSQVYAIRTTIIKLHDECVRCVLVERQHHGEHDEPGPDPLFPVDGARVVSVRLSLALLALLRAGLGDPAHLQSLGGYEPS